MDAYRWADTRDMGADGLTKGSIARDALRALMRGEVVFQHESRVFAGKGIEHRSAANPFNLRL